MRIDRPLLVLLYFSVLFLSHNNSSGMDIEADSVKYSRDDTLITASGNVTLKYDDISIASDHILYDQTAKAIMAFGNIKLQQDAYDNIYTADSIFFAPPTRGTLHNAKAFLSPNNIASVSRIDIYSNDYVRLYDLDVSPCYKCSREAFLEKKPLETPIWSITAKSALYTNRAIEYKNAIVKVKGVPVLYVPSFSTPASVHAGKTGFLPVAINPSSKVFGLDIKIPYYWKISDRRDATLALRSTQKLGQVYEGEYRERLKNGYLTLQSSFTKTGKFDKHGQPISGKEAIRGYYDCKSHVLWGEHDKKHHIRLNSKRVFDSSNTYLKKYHMDDSDILTSILDYSTYGGDSAYRFRGLHFQGIREDDDAKVTPAILPHISYDKDFTLKPMGTNVLGNVSASFLNLYREQGALYRRFMLANNFTIPKKLPSGQLLYMHTGVRAYYYHADYRPTTVSSNYASQNKYHGSTGSLYPYLRLGYSFPLKKGGLILEPLVNFNYSTRSKSNNKIDDEDSQATEISSSNVFNDKKHRGYDRFESGARFSYGIRGYMTSKYIDHMNFTIGQAYSFSSYKDFNPKSGLHTRFSDYVSNIHVIQSESFELYYNNRMTNNLDRFLRNELDMRLKSSGTDFNIQYVAVDKSLLSPDVYKREVHFDICHEFNDRWSLSSSMRRKLGTRLNDNTRMISTAISIGYNVRCLSLSFSIKRNYTRTRDFNPSTVYSVGVKPVF